MASLFTAVTLSRIMGSAHAVSGGHCWRTAYCITLHSAGVLSVLQALQGGLFKQLSGFLYRSFWDVVSKAL